MKDIIFKLGGSECYLTKYNASRPFVTRSLKQAEGFGTIDEAWFWYRFHRLNYPEARLVYRVTTIEEIKD